MRTLQNRPNAAVASQNSLTQLTHSEITTGTSTEAHSISAKTLADAIKQVAAQITGQVLTPVSATFAGLPTVDVDGNPATNGDVGVVSPAEVGTGTADSPQYPQGFYLYSGTAYDPTPIIRLGDTGVLTEAQIVSTTGADYEALGVLSTKLLDLWGRSRRMRRIFNTDASVDIPNNALLSTYPDRTAVFIRNINTANGISVTHGKATVSGYYANGKEITGNPADINVQPGEIACCEWDGTTFYISIFPAERVYAFTDYASANNFGPMPHDCLVIIRGTKEIWGRISGTNNVKFPANGRENSDWFRVVGGLDVVFHTTETATWQWGKLNIYPNGANLGNATSPSIVPSSEASLGTLDGSGGYVLARHYVSNEAGDAILNRSGDLITSSLTSFQHEWVVINNNSEHVFSLLPQLRFKWSSSHRQITAQATGADVVATNVWSRWEQGSEGQAQISSITFTDGTDRNFAATDINFSAAGAVEDTWCVIDGLRVHVTGYVDTAYSENLVEIWVEGNNPFVLPSGKDLVPTTTLSITAPTATPQFAIPTDRPARFKINVTPGKQLVLDSHTGFTVAPVLLSAIDGLIDVQGTDGQAATMVFSEVDLPGVVSVRNASLPNATWTDLTANLQIHQGTNTDDRPYVRFINQTKERLLEQLNWHSVSESSARGDFDTSFRFLSNEEVWDLEGSGYNLQPNYVQFIVLKDPMTGEEWRIKYTMDASDNDAVMDYDYWPETRTNPFV